MKRMEHWRDVETKESVQFVIGVQFDFSEYLTKVTKFYFEFASHRFEYRQFTLRYCTGNKIHQEAKVHPRLVAEVPLHALRCPSPSVRCRAFCHDYMILLVID